MMFLRVVCYAAGVAATINYSASIWDPIADDNEGLKRSVAVGGGFMADHHKRGSDSFGDLSILTFNMYTKNMENTTEEEMKKLNELIDNIHPTVFCLQGVEKDLMNKFAFFLKGSTHYGVANAEVSAIDVLNSHEYYLPIVYDTLSVKMVTQSVFKSKATGVLYGSWATFKSAQGTFIVVNLDLASAYKQVTNAEFANIVADIKTDPAASAYPVIFAGGITSMPKSLRKLITRSYTDALHMDDHNRKMKDKTTFHGGGKIKNYRTTDKIFMRDPKKKLSTNYARILQKFIFAHHYPVHAILSFTTKKLDDKPPKGLTNKDNDIKSIVEKSRDDQFNKRLANLKKRVPKQPSTPRAA